MYKPAEHPPRSASRHSLGAVHNLLPRLALALARHQLLPASAPAQVCAAARARVALRCGSQGSHLAAQMPFLPDPGIRGRWRWGLPSILKPVRVQTLRDGWGVGPLESGLMAGSRNGQTLQEPP